MIDIHSHILPGIDDGSKNVEESINMLGMLSNQGVDTVVATPHFYIENMHPDNFIEKRTAAIELLKNSLSEEITRPKIAFGAEVQFYYELPMLENIEAFCISGTKFMLVEMPFIHWTSHVYQTLEQLYNTRGITPIIAHLERYPEFTHNRDTAYILRESHALIQLNAEFIAGRGTKRKALGMFRQGLVSYIGSDAHNLSSRPPNINEAAKLMQKKLKPREVEYLMYWEERLKEKIITF